MTVTLFLPIPPSLNNAYVNVPGKGRVRSKAYNAWIEEAGWRLKIQRQANPEVFKGAVVIDLTVERRRKGVGDLDNFIKPCLDLLVKHGVIEDDSHVQEITARWGEKTTVRVSECCPDEDPEPVCRQCGAALDGAAPPLCEDCQDRERLTPPDEI